jgi:uncharacterized membrane protein
LNDHKKFIFRGGISIKRREWFVSILKRAIGLVLAGVLVFYPTLIYFGLKQYSPRFIALLVGICIAIGFSSQKNFRYHSRLVLLAVGIIVLCLASVILNQFWLMRYLPLFISIHLLLSFGYSLLRPPSTVEVFARMVTTDLSSEECRYCRLVTLLWVIFFLFNGMLAGLTACCTGLKIWSLYNGGIAYGAMGLLFAAELCYRHWRFRRYVGLPTDSLFKWLFPPRA